MTAAAQYAAASGREVIEQYLSGAATYAEDVTSRPELPDAAPSRNEIERQAAACARHCESVSRGSWDDGERLKLLQGVCAFYGVEFPKSRWGLGPSLLRLVDVKWWARKLGTVARRRFEVEQIHAGDVRRDRSIYCSNQAVFDWRAMRARNAEFAQQMFVFNDDQWLQSLAEIAKHSLANPEVRRAEMFARLRGLESYARDIGHQALFVTITCPSKYHAVSDKYNGSSPKVAQEYLCAVWSRIRAQLGREKVRYYGFRIAEPHHDGCPHWHMLLFMPFYEMQRVKSVIRTHGLREDGSEPGAQLRRVTFEVIDPKKGSAVGYIAKYISKNIDGRKTNGESIGQVNDRDGNALGDGIVVAERVLAWASLWGIRQFQQVGGERIGPYRELRRVHQIITASAVLENARQAADLGDFAAYQKAAEAMAVHVMNQCRALEALKAGDEPGAKAALNKYQEPVWRVVGVHGDGEEIITRRDDWRCMTEAAIHGMYEMADTAEAVEFWGELCEILNLLRAERVTGPPAGGPLDLCQ